MEEILAELWTLFKDLEKERTVSSEFMTMMLETVGIPVVEEERARMWIRNG